MGLRSTIQIALADDHAMFRNLLAGVINSFANCHVALQAANGRELVERLPVQKPIDIVILDVNMPVMNGYETARWLQENRPSIAVIIVSMFASEAMVMQMLAYGVKSFLNKNADVQDLRKTIAIVADQGFHLSGSVMYRAFFSTRLKEIDSQAKPLTDKELSFLHLACTDDTYKEIAGKLLMSVRAVEHMRDLMFVRFHVRSRAALAAAAIRSGVDMLPGME
ncbi:MAG: response regulator transcription factor [Flaviaesturariibacter sp.]|nr:response regulator transcription factor [Flaviaesturariibacter sp.]